ncbi:MAG: hypothetical protein R3B13_27940 [Polyangiaceae bacterium]
MRNPLTTACITCLFVGCSLRSLDGFADGKEDSVLGASGAAGGFSADAAPETGGGGSTGHQSDAGDGAPSSDGAAEEGDADATADSGDDAAPADSGLDACVPRTCGSACGALPNGCGKTLVCGGCNSGFSCITNKCVCTKAPCPI